MDITDTDIETLRTEAAQAGDAGMVGICGRALDGDDDARAECAEAIADAEAQGE